MTHLPSTEGVLFHYTTHEALHSIVMNQTIRATHAYYLNDSNEIRLAANEMMTLVDVASDMCEKYKFKSFLFELGRWLVSLKNNTHYIFVFSLSEHRNLLSQWRAYTKHGSGVSIGFSLADLRRLSFSETNALDLVKCVYDKSRRDELLQALMESVLQDFAASFPDMPEDHIATQAELNEFLNARTAQFLKTFCSIKDPAFREEGEWRLVSKYFPAYTDPVIQFRPGRSTLIPYIEIALKGMRNDGYLFEQVYPGPSPNFHLAYQAVSAFLSNKHACKVIINPQSSWTEKR